MQLTDLGRTAAYALTHRPDFPQPFALGPKTLRWDRAEVAEWLKGCRGRVAPKPTRQKSRRQSPRLSTMVVDGVTFRRAR